MPLQFGESGKTEWGCKLPDYLRDWIDEELSGGIVGFEWSSGYPIFYVNNRYLAYLGYTRKEIFEGSGRFFLNMIVEEERPRIQQVIQEAVEKQETYSAECQMLRKDGEIIWSRITGSCVMENGRKMLFAVCIDVTEMISLRQQVSIQNWEIAGLFESLSCGICKVALDDQFTLLYANRFFYAMYGYTSDTAGQAGFTSARFVIDPQDYPNVRQTVHSCVLRNRGSFELEHRMHHRSGETRWALSCCTYSRQKPNCLTCVVLDITDRKVMEEQLRISEEENRIAFSDTDRMMDVYEVAAKRLTQSERAEGLFGVNRVLENVPYSVAETGRVSADSMREYIKFFEDMQAGVPRGESLIHMRVRDGSFHWYAMKYTMIYSDEGEPQRAIISYDDVTEQREKELAFQKWSQYFDTQRENCVGYYEYNLTRDTFKEILNSAVEFPQEITTFAGLTDYIQANFIYEEDKAAYCEFMDRAKLLLCYYAGQRELSLEYRRRERTGGYFWARTTIQLMPDPFTGDIEAFLLVRDVDDEKRELLRLRSRVDTDPLTGLYNRAAIKEQVNRILQESEQKDLHAFIILDVDHFKLLNDGFGHQFGDQALRDVAITMKNALRNGDLCARLGGDEFIVFLRNFPSAGAVENRVAQLCRLLEKNYDAGALVTVSAGLALFSKDGLAFDELYERADEALYRAKESGRNRYAVYRREA